jgi:hypothetical protein
MFKTVVETSFIKISFFILFITLSCLLRLKTQSIVTSEGLN